MTTDVPAGSPDQGSRPHVVLGVSGGIAAYKACELIRLLRKQDAAVRCVLTEAGARFVTPLSLQALTKDKVYSDMFSLTDESEMGHIQLSRDADLLVVAPATANILARMAGGLADDLAARMEPGDPPAVARRYANLVDLLAAAQPLSDQRFQFLDPLPGQRRDRHDVLAPFGFLDQAVAFLAVDQVDLVPRLDPRRAPLLRLHAE